MHILGFDSSLYATFLDPDTGDVYNSGASPTILNLLHANRAGNTSGNYILQTPFVTAWAQDFFDCNTLTGMALENEEDHTNPGSHW